MRLDPDHGDQLRRLADDTGAELAWPLVWFDDDFGIHATRREDFVHKRRHLTTRLIHVDPGTGITGQHLSEAREALTGNP
ncbi:hypothetical protein FXN61_27485 [Lentzea sp. PSKA42]|uniref:Uncharacterized protein n=1 Tax=Lentzea indica TaxID=2604800 RepID=A0ABX1FNF8_9PSEU|nr:hypothetical protein [Lentzea indica]NKE60334.1 hypothetical protein [Lentzea indica]